jgi:hypothetical protein
MVWKSLVRFGSGFLALDFRIGGSAGTLSLAPESGDAGTAATTDGTPSGRSDGRDIGRALGERGNHYGPELASPPQIRQNARKASICHSETHSVSQAGVPLRVG